MTITLAERIDASQFDRYELIVRVHSAPDIGEGVIVIAVYSDGFTPDDPSQDFFGSAALCSVTVTNDTDAGRVLVDEITAELGYFLAVKAMFTPGDGGSGTARISADLLLEAN